MKTVKDVVAEYPDGWPMNGATNHVSDSAGYNVKDDILFTCHSSYQYSNKDEYKICTREEYEQELAKTKDDEWYDYDKQEVIDGRHPIKDEVIQACIGAENGFKNVSYATTVNNGSFDAHLCYILGEGSWFSADIRPLDYDKNKQRDEFIGKCVDVQNNTQWASDDLFAALYDAGARFK